MTTHDDDAHRRALLAAHLRRLLATAESRAKQPDDVSLTLEHTYTTTQINDLAVAAGLDPLPAALPAIATATGLRAEVIASLQRQQKHTSAYRNAAALQQISASPAMQVTLTMQIQQADERLAEIVQQLAELNTTTPPPVTKDQPMPPPVPTADQHRRLRALIGRCDELDTPRQLSALFADPRIALWRAGLPEADNRKGRVDLLISYLIGKRTTAGESALVLLLWVLAEKYDPADERHDNLLTLASELAYGVRVILPPNSSTNPELERTIRESNGMIDILPWMAMLANRMRCICRITLTHGGTTAYGTGFLLTPDIVITNYHVVERVITRKAPPSSVSLLFDYHLRDDGVTPHVGTRYTLATDDWLIDWSPSSPLDLTAHEGTATAPDQLDYALLRVAGAPGNELVQDRAGATSTPRGWIALPSEVYPFAAHTPLLIVQHPDGKELKLAMDTDAIIGMNRNGTRVRYRTNTEPGSSGAPCFDANWNLVALHHAGDPNYAAMHQPGYNQGIPFSAILSLLQARGKLALLNTAA